MRTHHLIGGAVGLFVMGAGALAAAQGGPAATPPAVSPNPSPAGGGDGAPGRQAPQVATFPKPGETLTLSGKPRTIVTTDIETDDYDSVVRYLLYANDFNTVGLVYGSSQWHWAGDGKGTLFMPRGNQPRASLRWTGTQHIQDLIAEYRKAYPNLRVHDRAYPTPEALLSVIKMGNIEVEGDVSKDTEGSNWIKDKLLDDVPGPLFLQAWGGTNTIARALMSIESQYKNTAQWPSIHRKISQKAIILSFAKQDNTYDTYIAVSWPDIRYDNIAGNAWGYWSSPNATNVLEKDRPYMRGPWTRANILDVGPIGAKYRVWGDGRWFEGDPSDNFGLTPPGNRTPMEKDHFISEGDTPAFLNLIDNGLRGWAHPSYGGWGNRLAKPVSTANTLNYWVTAQSEQDETGAIIPNYTSKRWVSYAQRDFAARLKWSVTPTYAGANHQPTIKVLGGLNRTARPGATVSLDASAADPDHNALTYKWWQYREAGSYPGAITFAKVGTLSSSFVVPADAKSGQTIHAILEVTDNGAPSLTRWERVIVTVR